MEQQLATKALRVDRVTDDLLIGKKGILYQVYASHCIDISPEMRSKVNIWTAEPLRKGSVTLKAIVKFAATLLDSPKGKAPTKDLILEVERKLDAEKIEDLRGLIWKAVWYFAAGVPPFKEWYEPWESPSQWVDGTMNIDQRLHHLYNILIGYTYFVTRGEASLKALRMRPSDEQKIKTMTLDKSKVYQVITVLSAWMMNHSDPYICAVQITVIWS